MTLSLGINNPLREHSPKGIILSISNSRVMETINNGLSVVEREFDNFRQVKNTFENEWLGYDYDIQKAISQAFDLKHNDLQIVRLTYADSSCAVLFHHSYGAIYVKSPP